MVPRRDVKAPRAEYRNLFRGLEVANKDLFAAAITKCITDVAVKLSVIVDGVFSIVIDKFLADLLPHHVYLKLNAKRGDNTRRVAVAIFDTHAAHATATAVAAPIAHLSPSEPPPVPNPPHTRPSQPSSHRF